MRPESFKFGGPQQFEVQAGEVSDVCVKYHVGVPDAVRAIKKTRMLALLDKIRCTKHQFYGEDENIMLLCDILEETIRQM